MKRVGSMLRIAREQQGLTLADVERATKIRRKFLEAIEHDDFVSIPSQVYTKGFIKNYSEFVGLDSDTVLAFFRRQTEDVSRSALLPHHSMDSFYSSWFSLTPGKFVGILIGGCIMVFLLYFALQYRHLQAPPNLVVDKPIVDQIVEEKKIEVVGKTDADAIIIINGISTLVRSDGTFFDQISLDPGINTITVTATSRFGKTATVIRKVGLKQ